MWWSVALNLSSGWVFLCICHLFSLLLLLDRFSLLSSSYFYAGYRLNLFGHVFYKHDECFAEKKPGEEELWWLNRAVLVSFTIAHFRAAPTLQFSPHLYSFYASRQRRNLPEFCQITARKKLGHTLRMCGVIGELFNVHTCIYDLRGFWAFQIYILIIFGITTQNPLNGVYM